MSGTTVLGTAGVAETFLYELTAVPSGPPRLTVYSDSGRTVVAQAEQTTVATANPSVFRWSKDAGLTADTYYLGTIIPTAAGDVADNDDTMILQSIGGGVSDGRLLDLSKVIEFMRLDDCNASVLTSASTTVQCILDGVQASLEAWLKRPVTVRQFTDTINLRSGQDILFLRETPILTISSYDIDGVAQTETTDYIKERWGLRNINGGAVATITYTAGLDGTSFDNSDLLYVSLRAAKRELMHYLNDTLGYERIRVEGSAIVFHSADTIFEKAELSRLRRKQRRQAGQAAWNNNPSSLNPWQS